MRLLAVQHTVQRARALIPAGGHCLDGAGAGATGGWASRRRTSCAASVAPRADRPLPYVVTPDPDPKPSTRDAYHSGSPSARMHAANSPT